MAQLIQIYFLLDCCPSSVSGCTRSYACLQVGQSLVHHVWRSLFTFILLVGAFVVMLWGA